MSDVAEAGASEAAEAGAGEVAVVGAGAWGTALAIQAARAGRPVQLWARDRTRPRGPNPRLAGIALPPAVRVVEDLPRHAAAILMAVPMQHLAAILCRMRTDAPLLLCCKGVEAGSLRLPHEVARAVLPGCPAALLSGPNFALDVARGLPAGAVIAAEDAGLRGELIALLATPAFRLYGNADVTGVAVGGAAKNVVAIAAGAVIGAGLGENARAALVTRGLAELGRLAVALGGRAETVAGLSGLGDLLLTCTGPGSRNFSLGVALGRGERLVDVLAARGGVTEGVDTTPALIARAEGLDLPICRAVAALLEGQALGDVIDGLLARPPRGE